MVTLQRFDNGRISIYIGDHLPPHVHVKLHDGRDCTVDLAHFAIKGRIVAREIRELLVWIKANRLFLLEEWWRCNP